jgi:radical SAM protein with 4Fe4S-binding SPASM domain
MNLSEDHLEEIISFFRRSQFPTFTVLGGEPTLHPRFDRMMDRILAEESFKSIIVFTNGVISDSALSFLTSNRDPRLRVAMNLNAPGRYNPSQWERTNEVMKSLGAKVGLGINIYFPGQEYDYLIAAIDEHGLFPHVRLGLTQPILGSENRYALEEDFPAIADDIIAFCERAHARGISCSFDCGFRFCMFSIEQHATMLRLAVRFQSNCSPIIDIGADANVWRCFPLIDQAKRQLADFDTRSQIVDFYDEKFKHFLPMGNRAECPQCLHRANGLCRGGCLARTLDSFDYQDSSASAAGKTPGGGS